MGRSRPRAAAARSRRTFRSGVSSTYSAASSPLYSAENVRQPRHHGATRRSWNSSDRPIATRAAPLSESAYRTRRSSPPWPQKKYVLPAPSPAKPSSAAPDARWTSSTCPPIEVKVARPGQEVGSLVVFANGSYQRLHSPHVSGRGRQSRRKLLPPWAGAGGRQGLSTRPRNATWPGALDCRKPGPRRSAVSPGAVRAGTAPGGAHDLGECLAGGGVDEGLAGGVPGSEGLHVAAGGQVMSWVPLAASTRARGRVSPSAGWSG